MSYTSLNEFEKTLIDEFGGSRGTKEYNKDRIHIDPVELLNKSKNRLVDPRITDEYREATIYWDKTFQEWCIAAPETIRDSVIEALPKPE